MTDHPATWLQEAEHQRDLAAQRVEMAEQRLQQARLELAHAEHALDDAHLRYREWVANIPRPAE